MLLKSRWNKTKHSKQEQTKPPTHPRKKAQKFGGKEAHMQQGMKETSGGFRLGWLTLEPDLPQVTHPGGVVQWLRGGVAELVEPLSGLCRA